MQNSAEHFLKEAIANESVIQAAHDRANRTALLEHARMGRSVPMAGKDTPVVWVTPKEIYAMYGLDEFGRELPTSG